MPPPLLAVPPKGLSLRPGRTAAFLFEMSTLSSVGAEATLSWSIRSSKGAAPEALTEGSRGGRFFIPPNGARFHMDIMKEEQGLHFCRVKASTGAVESAATLRVTDNAPSTPQPPANPRRSS